jgi:hypothetical protein
MGLEFLSEHLDVFFQPDEVQGAPDVAVRNRGSFQAILSPVVRSNSVSWKLMMSPRR